DRHSRLCSTGTACDARPAWPAMLDRHGLRCSPGMACDARPAWPAMLDRHGLRCSPGMADYGAVTTIALSINF
ncbi:MAG: hypothetical protein LBF90_02460, partial [Prevotellaceae bacterium]|nr:hypothetical protein [Prevotellaceae bacterium]